MRCSACHRRVRCAAEPSGGDDLAALSHPEARRLCQVQSACGRHSKDGRQVDLARRQRSRSRQDNAAVPREAVRNSRGAASDLSAATAACRFNLGLIPNKKGLSATEKISASSFCRRRLPVILVRAKMCQTLKQAVTLIEAGRERTNGVASYTFIAVSADVRVGPDTITDPAFLVTRCVCFHD